MFQEHLKDSSNWRLASLLDLKIVCKDGILYWNTLLIASLSPMLNTLLEVKVQRQREYNMNLDYYQKLVQLYVQLEILFLRSST